MSEIENIENLVENFELLKFPNPPKVVSCHYDLYSGQGTIWWDYKERGSSSNNNGGEITWEVKRYRLDPISKSFLPKGVQNYRDILPRKVLFFSSFSCCLLYLINELLLVFVDGFGGWASLSIHCFSD